MTPPVPLTPAQRAVAFGMLEDRGDDSLDAHVRRLMKDLGLEGYHTRNSIGSRRGFPDWEIWGTRIIHRELKTERGVLSVDQRHVGSLITKGGGDWCVWRPRDLLDGTIARQLARIAFREAALWRTSRNAPRSGRVNMQTIIAAGMNACTVTRMT